MTAQPPPLVHPVTQALLSALRRERKNQGQLFLERAATRRAFAGLQAVAPEHLERVLTELALAAKHLLARGGQLASRALLTIAGTQVARLAAHQAQSNPGWGAKQR